MGQPFYYFAVERLTLYVMASHQEEHELDERQEHYLEWLLTPASGRIPATQAAFAKQIGVDSSTLRRWEKKPWFRKEWNKRVTDLQGSPERTQTLLDSLYEKAVSGDTRAANLYLQATHRLTPAPTIEETTAKAMSNLSDEELDDLIATAARREHDRRRLRAV